MGKQKLESMDPIQNLPNRQVTFNKRKKGLLKKTMELSKLCEQDIFLVIFDREKGRLVTYNSSCEFDVNIVQKLMKQKEDLQYEQYENDDYHLFENEQKLGVIEIQKSSIYNQRPEQKRIKKKKKFVWKDFLNESVDTDIRHPQEVPEKRRKFDSSRKSPTPRVFNQINFMSFNSVPSPSQYLMQRQQPPPPSNVSPCIPSGRSNIKLNRYQLATLNENNSDSEHFTFDQMCTPFDITKPSNHQKRMAT